jgi:hypothetical protein
MAGIEAERESRGLQSAGGNCTKFWMNQSMETTQRSNWVVDLTRPLGGICVELKSDERVNAMSDVRVCVCVCVCVCLYMCCGRQGFGARKFQEEQTCQVSSLQCGRKQVCLSHKTQILHFHGLAVGNTRRKQMEGQTETLCGNRTVDQRPDFA